MAPLSDFLQNVHARLGEWLVVELAAHTTLMPATFSDVQFYVALRGCLSIRLPRGQKIELQPAEVGIILGATKHFVEVHDSGGTLVPFNYLQTSHDRDVPPIVQIGKAGKAACRFLAGRVAISWPVALSPACLPSGLTVPMGSCASGQSEILVSFERAARGAGAMAYLTKLSELVLIRGLRENLKSLTSLPPDDSTVKLARALRLIDGDPGKRWSVAGLAREVGMSRSSFAEKFVGHTGKRPMEVLIEHRLSVAAEMLVLELASVAEVAHRVGYRSEAAFSRRFMRQFGHTPGHFRKISRDSRKVITVQTAGPEKTLEMH